MKKYFCVADVHGFYDELIAALSDAGFDKDNEDHVFVSCGDLLDRGEQPLQCLEFVNSLQRKILIRGNHEDLMEEMLKRRYYLLHDLHNGTVQTIANVCGVKMFSSGTEFEDCCDKFGSNEQYKEYMKTLRNYYETVNHIFVHGWIPCNKTQKMGGYFYFYDPNWRNANSENWNNSRWYAGWNLWEEGIKEPNKTVICGHWHCSAPNYYLHHKGKNQYDCVDPFIDDGIVCIDAYTAHTHKINCYVVEDEELWK